MTALEQRLIAVLAERGETVAAAESLTGGLVTAALTSVPGASACVLGGVTAYATALKAALLGVDTGLLAARGAVDGTVAEQMASGIRRLAGADWGLATTGVAGPEAADGHAPGTVFVAVCGPDGAARHVRLALPGDREQVRAATVREVLALLQRCLGG